MSNTVTAEAPVVERVGGAVAPFGEGAAWSPELDQLFITTASAPNHAEPSGALDGELLSFHPGTRRLTPTAVLTAKWTLE